MSTDQVATIGDTVKSATSVQQGHCAHCGMHVVLNDVGKWMHTMSGIYPCQPAWQPARRPALTLLNGAKS